MAWHKCMPSGKEPAAWQESAGIEWHPSMNTPTAC